MTDPKEIAVRSMRPYALRGDTVEYTCSTHHGALCPSGKDHPGYGLQVSGEMCDWLDQTLKTRYACGRFEMLVQVFDDPEHRVWRFNMHALWDEIRGTKPTQLTLFDAEEVPLYKLAKPMTKKEEQAEEAKVKRYDEWGEIDEDETEE